MIILDIDDICQECPYFEGDFYALKTLDDKGYTTITCTNIEKCRRAFNRGRLRKEEKSDL